MKFLYKLSSCILYTWLRDISYLGKYKGKPQIQVCLLTFKILITLHSFLSYITSILTKALNKNNLAINKLVAILVFCNVR